MGVTINKKSTATEPQSLNGQQPKPPVGRGGLKTCVKRPLPKRPKIGFQDQLSLNAGQKYCRMLQWEHSAMLLTFIKLPFVVKIFVRSIFEWPVYIGITDYLVHEPVDEISNNLVCATSKAPDQPAHTRRLIRAFA